MKRRPGFYILAIKELDSVDISGGWEGTEIEEPLRGKHGAVVYYKTTKSLQMRESP